MNDSLIITSVELGKQVAIVNEKISISVSVVEKVPESIIKRLAFKLGWKGVKV